MACLDGLRQQEIGSSLIRSVESNFGLLDCLFLRNYFNRMIVGSRDRRFGDLSSAIAFDSGLRKRVSDRLGYHILNGLAPPKANLRFCRMYIYVDLLERDVEKKK